MEWFVVSCVCLLASYGEVFGESNGDKHTKHTTVHGASCILPGGKCNYNIYLNTNDNLNGNFRRGISEQGSPGNGNGHNVPAADMQEMKEAVEELTKKGNAVDINVAVNAKLLSNFQLQVSQALRRISSGNSVCELRLDALEKKMAGLTKNTIEGMEEENNRLMAKVLARNDKIKSLEVELNTTASNRNYFESLSNNCSLQLNDVWTQSNASREKSTLELYHATRNWDWCKDDLAAETSKAQNYKGRFNKQWILFRRLQVRMENVIAKLNSCDAEANMTESLKQACHRKLNHSNEVTTNLRENLSACRQTALDLRNQRKQLAKSGFHDTLLCPAHPLSSIELKKHIGERSKVQGYWGRDPLTNDGAYWVMDGYDKYSRTLVRFKSLDDLEQDYNGTAFHLPEACVGSQHNMYNNTFFCLSAHQPLVNAWNVSFNPPRLIKRIELFDNTDRQEGFTENVGYKNGCPYKWGGFSDVDIEIDELGIYVIYGAGDDYKTCKMRVKKLNKKTLEVEKTWDLSNVTKHAGNAFFVCGTLYVTDHPHTQPTFIKHTFNTLTGDVKHIDKDAYNTVFYPNRFSYNAHLHYDLEDKLLYGWENRNLVSYSLKFE